MEVTPVEASQAIELYLHARLVPLLIGSPGTGKSQLVHQIADRHELALIDLRLTQCDPCDLAGFPTVEGGKADYVPMKHFPIEGDPLPEGKQGWLLFLDEITSAPSTIQAASYKLILDRMVGSHRLHQNVAIVAAGNKDTDHAIVETMSTALQSRLVHLEMEVSAEQWVDWAIRHDIDHRITSYIQFKPSMVYTFRPDHTDRTYACPRTWEFANRLLEQTEFDAAIMPALLSGCLSEGVAREFLSFCRIYRDLPTIKEIARSPETVKVSDEPSILWALTGAIANHMAQDNATQLMVFVARLPAEFQIVCMRELVRRNHGHRALLAHPAVSKWISTTAHELF